ncbi:MAG TPA: hypothetical protein VNQ76_14045 [Planctomicrobium sp.]|nr:hypothetical protein [Planctomicrobium sp.]
MWPSESPWIILIISLVGVIISIQVWMTRQHWGALAVAIVCLFLAAGGVIYDQVVVTPREMIGKEILAMTSAFQKRDLDKTLSYISDSAWDVKLLAAEGYNQVELHNDMRVSDIQVEMLAQGQRARAQFRVNTTATYKQGGAGRLATMWESKWQQETDGWKMIEIVALDPLNSQQLPFLESYRERVRRLYPRGE